MSSANRVTILALCSSNSSTSRESFDNEMHSSPVKLEWWKQSWGARPHSSLSDSANKDSPKLPLKDNNFALNDSGARSDDSQGQVEVGSFACRGSLWLKQSPFDEIVGLPQPANLQAERIRQKRFPAAVVCANSVSDIKTALMGFGDAGTVATRGDSDTPYPHRVGTFMSILYLVVFDSIRAESLDSANYAWLHKMEVIMKGYIDLDKPAVSNFGASNFASLQAIKAKVDPFNVFMDPRFLNVTSF
ncbi:hypothetical protein BC830DRAFT_1079148 [Chytriomyces sp. MP71]|nr:hypothetical protein BC830DRAFT_1079148 [Chytriomyces sp. MP71]